MRTEPVDFVAAREVESLRQENENLKLQIKKLEADLKDALDTVSILHQYNDPSWRN